MKLKLVTAIGLILVFVAFSLSISESANKSRCEIMSELVDQMKDYSIKEIIPQKKLWKKALDRAMTAKDLKTLNLLRAKGAVINSNTSKAFADLQINGTNSAENISEAEKRINVGHQIKIKKLHNKLAPLRGRYKAELDEIISKAKTMSLKWRTEMTAIQKKWGEKNKNLLNNQSERKHSEGRQTGLRSGQGRGMGRQGRGMGGQGRGMGGQGRGMDAHENHIGDRGHSNYEKNDLRQFRNHLDPIYLIPDNLSDSPELYNFMLWDGTLPKDNKKVFDQENDSDEFEDFDSGN